MSDLKEKKDDLLESYAMKKNLRQGLLVRINGKEFNKQEKSLL